MFERILVPLDGSPRSEVILPLLARILRREDSEVLLLTVVETPPGMIEPGRGSPPFDPRRYLHDLALRFAGTGAKVNGRVVQGSPAATILDVAAQEGVTLIAMSTHGRTGLARWMLGSTTEKVARASDVPLLLVRSFRRGPKGDLEPVPPQELPFRRLLVPVDGSPTSLEAVGPAAKFAQLYGSEVLVLHVEQPYIPPTPVLPGMEVVLPAMSPPATPSEKDPATEKAAARFQQAGLRTARLTALGEPASQILDVGAERGADLIALGSHGRSGLARWSLGSVAERVLRASEVPLLLVRTARGPR